jgi:hypothetical protein
VNPALTSPLPWWGRVFCREQMDVTAPQTFHLLVRGSSQGGISPAVDNRRVNSNSPMENAPTSFTPSRCVSRPHPHSPPYPSPSHV